MFRPVILLVLFLRVYVHVDDLLVCDNLKNADVFVRDAAVPKITVCVTFFAVRCGPTNRPICARSDYVTFSTIAATAVREMTVCAELACAEQAATSTTSPHPTNERNVTVRHHEVAAGAIAITTALQVSKRSTHSGSNTFAKNYHRI